MDKPLAAADIFFSAALNNPDLIAEAAELYRRAGHLYRSLGLNAQITDPTKKLKQRLALYLELQRYDQITAMEDAMTRAGLLAEEDLRYALAYAFFQLGDHESAEAHLAQLTRPDLFRKAVELRRAMAECAEESWRCS
jgi:thioredoxin-like negative regulator of GroEL